MPVEFPLPVEGELQPGYERNALLLSRNLIFLRFKSVIVEQFSITRLRWIVQGRINRALSSLVLRSWHLAMCVCTDIDNVKQKSVLVAQRNYYRSSSKLSNFKLNVRSVGVMNTVVNQHHWQQCVVSSKRSTCSAYIMLVSPFVRYRPT